MFHVFISHVEEDESLAQCIAEYIEKKGYSTWYYERDSVPGVSYLIQTGQAIENARAVLLIVSPVALGSYQITKEIVRAHEARKPFIPVLLRVSHREMQIRQPEWREALGAAASIRIPSDGPAEVLPRILAGLQFLGVLRGEESSIAEEEDPSKSELIEPLASAGLQPPSFDEIAAHPEVLVDRQIGPFLLRSFVGRGGSGIVYRVRNTTLGRELALRTCNKTPPDLERPLVRLSRFTSK
jgi:hypothetical protein